MKYLVCIDFFPGHTRHGHSCGRKTDHVLTSFGIRSELGLKKQLLNFEEHFENITWVLFAVKQ